MWKLNSQCDGTRRWGLGRQPGLEVLGVGTPWWDMCPYKEINIPEWNLSAMWGCCKMTAVSEPGGWPSPDTKLVGTLILNFSTSRNVRNKRLLFKALHLWNFVIAAWTKTVSASIMIVSFPHLFFRYVTDPKWPTKRERKKKTTQAWFMDDLAWNMMVSWTPNLIWLIKGWPWKTLEREILSNGQCCGWFTWSYILCTKKK